MAKTVKKFKLFDEIIEIKDEYARGVLSGLANTKRYGVYKQIALDGNLCSDYRGGVISNTTKVGDDYGTLTNPYQSLDYAIEMFNQGETHLMLYIKTSGVYVVKKPIVSDLMLRIQVQANNVTIIFDSSDSLDDSFEFYNSIIRIYADDNVDKVTVKTTNETNSIRFEQCDVLLRNVIYDGCIFTYGCYVLAYTSKVGQLELHGCKGQLYNMKITNNDSSKTGLYLARGSHIQVEGAETDFEGLNGESPIGEYMIKLHYSTLNLSVAQNKTTNYANGIYCYASTLFCTNARYATFNDNTQNGNYITQSILVDENGIGY